MAISLFHFMLALSFQMLLLDMAIIFKKVTFRRMEHCKSLMALQGLVKRTIL